MNDLSKCNYLILAKIYGNCPSTCTWNVLNLLIWASWRCDWSKLKVVIRASWRWWSEQAEGGDQSMLKVVIRASWRWWSEHAEGYDHSNLKVVIRASWRWWSEQPEGGDQNIQSETCPVAACFMFRHARNDTGSQPRHYQTEPSHIEPLETFFRCFGPIFLTKYQKTYSDQFEGI